MTRPTRLIRAFPRPEAGGVDYDNDSSGLDADTIQEAIDELAALIAGLTGATGYPRPLMAFDPDLDMWFVVVDLDGTAVMVTSGP